LANFTAPSRFAPSPAYSATPATRNSRSDRRPTRAPALLDQAVDLGLLAALEGERGELHVADPQRHAALGDAEGGGDLGQGQAGAAQPACLLLLAELAPVAHGRILP
jgi:hypothetical protein